MSTPPTWSTQRLMRDLATVLNEPLSTIAACPLESDIFEWHCNMVPSEGPFAGFVFHFVLKFPQDYPARPPRVEMCSYIKHPNVFFWGGGHPYICLDLLQEHVDTTGGYNGGWSSGYTVQSILLQLQSFLFEENSIPQEDGKTSVSTYGTFYGTKGNKSNCTKQIDRAKNEATRFVCKCGHTHAQPWPALAQSTGVVSVPRYNLPKKSKWQQADDGWIEEQQGEYVVRKRIVNGKVMETTIKRGQLQAFQQEQKEQQDRVRQVCSRVACANTTANTAVAIVPQNDGQCHLLCDQTNSVVLPDDVLLMVLGLLPDQAVIQFGQSCKALASFTSRSAPLTQRELVCFHTKLGFREDILGVGVNVIDPQKKAASRIEAPLDLLSHTAFATMGVKQSVWKESFQHWLPLAFDRQHQQAVGTQLELSIAKIAGSDRFQPSMALEVLPKLMNSAVVRLVSDNKEIQQHASEAALLAYCAYHHLLLVLAERHPSIVEMAERTVDDFCRHEQSRNKGQVPNLGEMLVLLTLTERRWEQIAPVFILETFSRNAKWMLESAPELAYLESHNSVHRVRTTWAAARTSQRLLMFQVCFLRLLGRPASAPWTQVLEGYNTCFGRPVAALRRQLHRSCQEILAVKSSSEFFDRLGVPAPPELCAVLRCAIRDSEAAGYHKYFWYKMDWNQIKRKRAVESDVLENGKGSSPRCDYSAQKDWLRLMRGEQEAKHGCNSRSKARPSREATMRPNSTRKDAQNRSKSVASQNPFAVLELDENDVADSA